MAFLLLLSHLALLSLVALASSDIGAQPSAIRYRGGDYGGYGDGGGGGYGSSSSSSSDSSSSSSDSSSSSSENKGSYSSSSSGKRSSSSDSSSSDSSSSSSSGSSSGSRERPYRPYNRLYDLCPAPFGIPTAPLTGLFADNVVSIVNNVPVPQSYANFYGPGAALQNCTCALNSFQNSYQTQVVAGQTYYPNQVVAGQTYYPNQAVVGQTYFPNQAVVGQAGFIPAAQPTAGRIYFPSRASADVVSNLDSAYLYCPSYSTFCALGEDGRHYTLHDPQSFSVALKHGAIGAYTWCNGYNCANYLLIYCHGATVFNVTGTFNPNAGLYSTDGQRAFTCAQMYGSQGTGIPPLVSDPSAGGGFGYIKIVAGTCQGCAALFGVTKLSCTKVGPFPPPTSSG